MLFMLPMLIPKGPSICRGDCKGGDHGAGGINVVSMGTTILKFSSQGSFMLLKQCCLCIAHRWVDSIESGVTYYRDSFRQSSV